MTLPSVRTKLRLHISFDEIGRKAMELLATVIREESLPGSLSRLLIEPSLTVRNSCAAPKSVLTPIS